MSDVRGLLQTAAKRLSDNGIGSPESDALQLLAFAWDRSASDVRRASVMGEQVPYAVCERLEDLVAERCTRVPLQHLTGVAAFRGLTLKVGPGVFVPRPETESIVDLVLARVPDGGIVVDLCTGGGPIALACKAERPDLRVIGVERERQAHAWAVLNRDALGLDVDLVNEAAQDCLPELDGQVDVVVSNPPYIPDGMVPVDPEVRDHDPAAALYGGSADGLRIPLEVAARAALLARLGGFLVMEHADTQGDSLPRALRTQGWVKVEDHTDLTGRPRFAVAVRPAG